MPSVSGNIDDSSTFCFFEICSELIDLFLFLLNGLVNCFVDPSSSFFFPYNCMNIKINFYTEHLNNIELFFISTSLKKDSTWYIHLIIVNQ